MVDTDQSVRILTKAFTWFFFRTEPTSRKANPACMAKTMTAPSMRKSTSLLLPSGVVVDIPFI